MLVAKIGKITITAVTDGAAPSVDPSWPFPKVPPALWGQHQYALDHKGLHKSNFGSFIIQVNDDIMLVDTGLGPRPPIKYGNPPSELPQSIKNAGYSLADINVVFFTHLHFDHVGWALNYDLSGPFFPNARYIASKSDWVYWESCKDMSRIDHIEAFKKTIHPLVNLGQLELIDGETTLLPGISALPTPGHTPGHMSLLLESNGDREIILGLFDEHSSSGGGDKTFIGVDVTANVLSFDLSFGRKNCAAFDDSTNEVFQVGNNLMVIVLLQ